MTRPTRTGGAPTRWAICVGLGLTAVAECLAATPQLPEAAEYAYGFPVSTEDEADLYRVSVPPALYRSTADPELRDCGVYNAAGKPVLRVFDRPGSAEPRRATPRPVPWFALSQAESPTPDRLRLMIEHSGSTLHLDTTGPASVPLSEIAAYIVDTREVEEKIAAVHLEWPAAASNFIGRVEIDRSDDLATWVTVGSGTVADLQRDGGRIERRSIELPETRSAFLRIRWDGLPDEWSLSALAVEPSRQVVPLERSWIELPPQAAEITDEGDWIFDLGGSPPVDQIQLDLPDDNAVVRARLFAWEEAAGSWRPVHQGLFYRLRQAGNALSNEPATISPRRARRFKVEVTRGRLDGEWSARFGWRPDELVFVAQGEGPYRVVAGRALDAAEGFPQHAVLGDSSILDLVEGERFGRASLGERFDLGGANRLAVPRQAMPVKEILLWLVLVAGVLFVGWMAWRVLKEGPAGH